MFFEVEQGGEVQCGNPGEPLRLRQPRFDRPAGLQRSAVSRNIFFGNVEGAIHLRHFLKHGYESQTIFGMFYIHLWSFNQVTNLVGDEGVALGVYVQRDLVVKKK